MAVDISQIYAISPETKSWTSFPKASCQFQYSSRLQHGYPLSLPHPCIPLGTRSTLPWCIADSTIPRGREPPTGPLSRPGPASPCLPRCPLPWRCACGMRDAGFPAAVCLLACLFVCLFVCGRAGRPRGLPVPFLFRGTPSGGCGCVGVVWVLGGYAWCGCWAAMPGVGVGV